MDSKQAYKREDIFWTNSGNSCHSVTIPCSDSSAIAGHRNEVSKNFFVGCH